MRHERELEMNQRALLVFLAFCICASIFYISIVYLDTGRKGRIITTIYSINAAEASKIAKYRADCKHANCQDVDLTKLSHTSIEELRQQFHPNYATSPSIRPITRTTNADIVPVEITTASREDPTSITNLGRKRVQIPFNPYGMDTMVYMHIQKTGGSEFLEHLVTAQIPLKHVKISSKRFKKITCTMVNTDIEAQLTVYSIMSNESNWWLETGW